MTASSFRPVSHLPPADLKACLLPFGLILTLVSIAARESVTFLRSVPLEDAFDFDNLILVAKARRISVGLRLLASASDDAPN